MTTPSLELICLGPPTVRLGDTDPPPDVLWRKHVALLTYLALSPDRVRSRDHLIGLLWPDKSQEAARHSLSEALRRLRASLGAERLRADGDRISLSDLDLTVDAARFEALGERDPDAALALYRGDFLDGFALGDADGFDDWAGGVRRRLSDQAVRLLVRSGEQALARGAHGAAAELALRAAVLNPLGAVPVGLLMRARALAGDGSAALAAFHEYAARLESELGESPDPALAALAERLRRQGGQGGRPVPVMEEPPFIGSATAATVFREATDALRGAGPRAVIVMGAPGFGRSRLLEEVQRRAALAGASVATARALAGDQDAAWSTLRQLMRQGLAGAPGVLGADPEAVGVAAHFAPSLAGRVTPVEPKGQGHVAGALAALIASAAEEAPLAVLLDDADLADGDSLAAIHGALRMLQGSRVALVLTVSADIEAPGELLALSAEIGGLVPGVFARMAPLEAADLHQLVSALAPGEKAEDADRLARRLAMETGGSPFWAVTLLRALESSQPVRREMLNWPPRTRTFEAPLPAGVPDLARLAAASRLAALAPRERRLLLAAAVARSADPGLLAAICGDTAAETESALAELERAHLLRFEEGRYGFAAPLLATVIRAACVTSGERERLRARAVATLDERADDVEAAVLAAELVAERGRDDAAVTRGIAAGRAALARHSMRAAARALRAAEQGCTPDDAGSIALIDALRTDIARAEARGSG